MLTKEREFNLQILEMKAYCFGHQASAEQDKAEQAKAEQAKAEEKFEKRKIGRILYIKHKRNQTI